MSKWTAETLLALAGEMAKVQHFDPWSAKTVSEAHIALRAYAERLEQDARAVPVAWLVVDAKGKKFTIYNPELAEAIKRTADQVGSELRINAVCELPKGPWYCTRPANHEGPCAAWPNHAPAQASESAVRGDAACVPKSFVIDKDAWEAAQFAFGGPGTGEGEEFMDCIAWVGDIDNDDGSKTHGLHIQCCECPEEGSITLAEFAANPASPEAGERVDGWVEGTTNPVVASGNTQFFWIAVRRASGDKVYTFPALYANAFPLCSTEDDPEERHGPGWSQTVLSENDEGDIAVTGWYGVESDDEYDSCYRPVCSKGDEVVAWHEGPSYPANPSEPAQATQFDRARETPRRQQAVEMLLELGWTYHTERGWEEPAQAAKVVDGDFPERKWFVITGANKAETPILLFTSRQIAEDYCSRNPRPEGYSIYGAASTPAEVE